MGSTYRSSHRRRPRYRGARRAPLIGAAMTTTTAALIGAAMIVGLLAGLILIAG